MSSLDIGNCYRLSEVCKELSISVATGKNWLKLGKLNPQIEVDGTFLFTRHYIEKLKDDIRNNKNKSLKNRRNKKYISGSRVYDFYISAASENKKKIQEVLEIISDQGLCLGNQEIQSILAECALQMILQRENIGTCARANVLAQYLKGTLSLNGYEFLIEDLLADREQALEFAGRNPVLFSVEYLYEEGEDILGLLYLSCKNIKDRKAAGSYYTPTTIVKKLISELINCNNIEKRKIFDPCCGTGNFFLQLPGGVSIEHIFGNDLDLISINLARINLALKFHCIDQSVLYKHITAKDYLTFEKKREYDFIIGNPPWGYEFSDEERGRLRKKYTCAANQSIESYDIFIEQAVSNLKCNGVLSFVLPDALLNVKTHVPIRSFLMETVSFQYLEYLGNVFDQVQCPCIILQMCRRQKTLGCAGMRVNDGSRIYTIQKERKMDKEYFCFTTTDEEYQILQKIEQVPSKATLAGNAKFALGIVTGNNKEKVTDKKTTENEIVLKGSDLKRFRYAKPNRYLAYQPELFQQAAPQEVYRAKEKLLYRFICKQLVFAYDDKQTLSLNSCNVLIPKIKGTEIKYIMAVLNSRIAQFYFEKKFHSVKVLKSHIEQIPIPVIERQQQKQLVQIVDELLNSDSHSTVKKKYELLDQEIAKIFKLSTEEYHIIMGALGARDLCLY